MAILVSLCSLPGAALALLAGRHPSDAHPWPAQPWPPVVGAVGATSGIEVAAAADRPAVTMRRCVRPVMGRTRAGRYGVLSVCREVLDMSSRAGNGDDHAGGGRA
jgi:hypothetical protein